MYVCMCVCVCVCVLINMPIYIYIFRGVNVLYTVPKNINGYALFLIDTLDTIVRGVNMMTK